VDRARHESDEGIEHSHAPSRRAFLRNVAGAGAAVGAAAWVAPQLSSVALAADGTGSPPPGPRQPVDSTGNEEQPSFEEVPGNVVDVPVGTGSGGANVRRGGGSGGGGMLPFTGSDPKKLVVTGGAAIAGGKALIEFSKTIPDPDPGADTQR
jgi:hypothetical protein